MKRSLLKYLLAFPIGINLGFAMEEDLYEKFNNSQGSNSSQDSETLYEKCGSKNNTSSEKANETTQITTELDDANTEKSKQLGEGKDSPNISASSATANEIANINSETNNINNEKSEQLGEIQNIPETSEKSKNSNVKDITINSEVKNELEQKNQSNINININDVKQDEPKKQQNSVNSKTGEQLYTLLPYVSCTKTRIMHKEATDLDAARRDMERLGLEIDENFCLLLDADLTMVKALEASIASEYKKQWELIESIFEQACSEYSENYNYYTDIFLREHKEIPTENIWPDFLNYIKAKGGKVLVVTAIENQYLTKQSPNDPEKMWIESRREKINNILDPTGDAGSPPIENTLGSKAKNGPLREGDISLYHFDGMLTSGKQEKASVVYELFRQIGYKPKILVAIDDRDQNLYGYDYLASMLGARLITYQLLKANFIKYNFKLEPEVAFYQLLYLVKNKKWLSDPEAKSALAHCSDEEKTTVNKLMKRYKDYTEPPEENELSKTPKTKLKGK